MSPSAAAMAPQGREARDLYLGRLFGLAALVRTLALRGGGGGVREPAVLAAVADELCALCATKGYLREAATAVLRDLLLLPPPAASAAAVLDASAAAQTLLFAAPEAADANTLWLALSLWDRLPPHLAARCPVRTAPARRRGCPFRRRAERAPLSPPRRCCHASAPTATGCARFSSLSTSKVSARRWPPPPQRTRECTRCGTRSWRCWRRRSSRAAAAATTTRRAAVPPPRCGRRSPRGPCSRRRTSASACPAPPSRPHAPGSR